MLTVITASMHKQSENQFRLIASVTEQFDSTAQHCSALVRYTYILSYDMIQGGVPIIRRDLQCSELAAFALKLER